jgi:hypothetical protein
MEVVDEAVRTYIDSIRADYRPLFDRLHGLILTAHPDAVVMLSYQIPAYKVGRRRLFLAAWQHGVSIYGWQEDRDAGFSGRHSELKSGKATIRLRPQDADGISDQEFTELIQAALKP